MWDLLFRFIDGDVIYNKAIKDKVDKAYKFSKVNVLENNSDNLLNQAENLLYKLDILHNYIKRVLNE